MEMLVEIFNICIIPLLGILTTYLVKWLSAKSLEIQVKTENDLFNKYIAMLTETVTECVISTNQTYVNTLKEKGTFDEKAQKEAFQRTYESVLAILATDAKEYLSNAVGDLNVLITEKIEKGQIIKN